MKKLYWIAGVAIVVLAFTPLVAEMVMAKNNQLASGTELAAARCDEKGKPIINVTEKVANTVDSGVAGNYWAFDTINRRIQVWDNNDGTYCASVRNEGTFDAQAGQTSPGGSGTLTGNEDGTLRGGYRATITGTLAAKAKWRHFGSIGTTDYKCTIDGSCPGYVNWVGQYFDPGYSFTYDWWGWLYGAGKHGTWLNSSDGTTGDLF